MITRGESGGEAGATAATQLRLAGNILGQLHEFQPDRENFTVYLERVLIIFAMNNVPAEKRYHCF